MGLVAYGCDPTLIADFPVLMERSSFQIREIERHPGAAECAVRWEVSSGFDRVDVTGVMRNVPPEKPRVSDYAIWMHTQNTSPESLGAWIERIVFASGAMGPSYFGCRNLYLIPRADFRRFTDRLANVAPMEWHRGTIQSRTAGDTEIDGHYVAELADAPGLSTLYLGNCFAPGTEWAGYCDVRCKRNALGRTVRKSQRAVANFDALLRRIHARRVAFRPVS